MIDTFFSYKWEHPTSDNLLIKPTTPGLHRALCGVMISVGSSGDHGLSFEPHSLQLVDSYSADSALCLHLPQEDTRRVFFSRISHTIGCSGQSVSRSRRSRL